MNTARQQFLLTIFLLGGSLLIGLLTYRPALPPEPEITTLMKKQEPGPELQLKKQPPAPASPPTPVAVKKERFFSRLLPLVLARNQQVQQLRDDLVRLTEKVEEGVPLSSEEWSDLQRLARQYRIRGPFHDPGRLLEKLLRKVDLLPPSLALAQAANESAWGESRFARDANNLFGQWCFTEGCGLVPKNRPEGMNHEVAYFDSWQASLAAYYRNINSHPAYKPLRDIRAQLRAQNLPLDGQQLALGLEKYSARGSIYIESLQRIIRVNKLDRLDQPRPAAEKSTRQQRS